ncbi:hypothetical protein CY34DRAFT_478055 [Suillus luteus UH-Slu-Lm8-n1]|uniref:Uncharacterized protein n=1 Tax=Suillus luteus UH-Slu-Lm8-n1 TaxID=930992 RepID=A0A0C9ZI55_9AGAM|nr:hypothetical protein CY34DRAFT_478055 [Suillus luteus UH-Slu-Lm8-n1]
MPEMEVHTHGEDSEDDELKTARKYMLGGHASPVVQAVKHPVLTTSTYCYSLPSYCVEPFIQSSFSALAGESRHTEFGFPRLSGRAKSFPRCSLVRSSCVRSSLPPQYVTMMQFKFQWPRQSIAIFGVATVFTLSKHWATRT